MVFEKKKKIQFKYKAEIITGLIVTIIGGIAVATYQFFLSDKKVEIVQPTQKKVNLDLKSFYTFGKYEINDLQDKDSSTYDSNSGTKMAGFYITSFFNLYTGIKKSIGVSKDQYFCNMYDMKSIVAVSGISVHNPNIQPYAQVKLDYYDGTIKNGFAYYNPEIIKWATEYLIPNPNEINIQGLLFLDIYSELYRKNTRLIAESYLYFSNEQSYKMAQQDYLSAMEKSNFDGSTYLLNKYGQGNDCQFCFGKPMAIGFWLRRGIDGTNDEIWQGLSKFLKLYDLEWFNSHIATDKEVWKNG